MLNGVALGTTMAGSNGAWTFDDTAMTLPDGNYAITAVAEDVAGNISTVSGAFNATVETVDSPVIAGVSLVTTRSGSSASRSAEPAVAVDRRDGPGQRQVQVYLGGTLLGTATPTGRGPGVTLRPLLVHGPRRDLRLLGHGDGRSRGTSARRRRRSSSRSAAARRPARRSTPRGPSRARRPRAAWSRSSTATSSSAS